MMICSYVYNDKNENQIFNLFIKFGIDLPLIGRSMVAKNPKKIWNERNICKNHTKYGGNGMIEIQHTVSSVEME